MVREEKIRGESASVSNSKVCCSNKHPPESVTSNTRARLFWAEPWNPLQCVLGHGALHSHGRPHCPDGVQLGLWIVSFCLFFETVSLCVPGWPLTALTILLP